MQHRLPKKLQHWVLDLTAMFTPFATIFTLFCTCLSSGAEKKHEMLFIWDTTEEKKKRYLKSFKDATDPWIRLKLTRASLACQSLPHRPITRSCTQKWADSAFLLVRRNVLRGSVRQLSPSLPGVTKERCLLGAKTVMNQLQRKSERKKDRWC